MATASLLSTDTLGVQKLTLASRSLKTAPKTTTTADAAFVTKLATLGAPRSWPVSRSLRAALVLITAETALVSSPAPLGALQLNLAPLFLPNVLTTMTAAETVSALLLATLGVLLPNHASTYPTAVLPTITAVTA